MSRIDAPTGGSAEPLRTTMQNRCVDDRAPGVRLTSDVLPDVAGDRLG